MNNWKNALYELTRSQSAKSNLDAVRKISIFEDEFLIPLINGSFDTEELCKAIEYWRENKWLKDWLNKYVNTRSEYEIFLGTTKVIEQHDLPQLGEITEVPFHSSDEDSCAITWNLNKKLALKEASWFTKESDEGRFGYIVSTIPSEESLVLDYRHLYGILRKWYNKNEDFKERWDCKLDENVLKNLYKKAKSYFNNKEVDTDTKATAIHIPDNIPSMDEWDYKNIIETLTVLAEEGDSVLVLRELNQATCIARWVNADGKVMKDGEW